MDSGTDDYNLVKSIINGNTDDFRILVNKYKKLVSHIIFRLVSDPVEKDDLGQEIFMNIYQALPKFEFRSNLATWISKISYNYCVNYLRRRKAPHRKVDYNDERELNQNSARAAENMETVSANCEQPDETLIKNEIYRYLDNAINALPIRFRKIITFFYLDNMSHLEIAEIMDIPVGSVKGYLFRARKQLKNELLLNYDMEDICP